MAFPCLKNTEQFGVGIQPLRSARRRNNTDSNVPIQVSYLAGVTAITGDGIHSLLSRMTGRFGPGGRIIMANLAMQPTQIAMFYPSLNIYGFKGDRRRILVFLA